MTRMTSGVLGWGVIEGAMADEKPIGNDGGNTETQNEVRPHHENWREVAEKVQEERDPKRIGELVEQLLVSLEEEQLRKVRRNPEARSE